VYTTARLAQSAAPLPEPTAAKILKLLARASLLDSQRGTAMAVYGLARPRADITVAEIIVAVDGPIALAACVEGSSDHCGVEQLCSMRGRKLEPGQSRHPRCARRCHIGRHGRAVRGRAHRRNTAGTGFALMDGTENIERGRDHADFRADGGPRNTNTASSPISRAKPRPRASAKTSSVSSPPRRASRNGCGVASARLSRTG